MNIWEAGSERAEPVALSQACLASAEMPFEGHLRAGVERTEKVQRADSCRAGMITVKVGHLGSDAVKHKP